MRVMKRVKLMLDPSGSKLGRDLPPDGYDNMTQQQKDAHEADQIMRGMGNKCLRKILESLVMSAIIMAFLHQSGLLKQIMFKISPQLFESKIAEGSPDAALNAEL